MNEDYFEIESCKVRALKDAYDGHTICIDLFDGGASIGLKVSESDFESLKNLIKIYGDKKRISDKKESEKR